MLDGEQFGYPAVNPNNGDQFAFAYHSGQGNHWELRTYDLQSLEESVLLETYLPVGGPKWGAGGWVVTDNAADFLYQIQLVSPETGMAQNLTEALFNVFPSWTPSGDSVVWQQSENLGVPYVLAKQGVASSTPEILYNGFTAYPQVSSDQQLVAEYFTDVGERAIGWSNLTSVDFNAHISLPTSQCDGLCWHPNGTSFFYANYTDGGLWEVNTDSGAQTLVLEHCDTRYFRNPSVDAQGEWLYVERVIQELERSSDNELTGNVLARSSICRLNLESKVLEEILVSE